MEKYSPRYSQTDTKTLVFSSTIIIALGLGFVWFGLKPAPQPKTAFIPTPSPIIETSPVATTSARPLTPERSDGERAVASTEGERVLVTKVVDGDTIEVEGRRAVRFIGVDTPETVDPRRSIGCFGKEASNKTKGLLSGKVVILQTDISETDKYGRLLRYIYLPLENGQTLFVNDYLVREGFAKVLTYPPDVKYNEQFREAERQAKEGKKGLWGRC